MTILDKVTLQQQDTTKIFIFKEGVFYKAYNQGAFLLKDEFVFEFFEWYAVYNTNIFFDKELYIDWHNKVVKDSFKTSKTETWNFKLQTN